jgi:hypothetical protein
MLVLVRHPLGAGGALLSLALFAAFLLSTLSEGAGAVREGDPRVLEIRAESAPLVASDLASFQERRRRDGAGYARGTDALVSEWTQQFPRRDRDEMLDWTRYHGAHATATRSGFTIETSSGPGASGWFRIEVDRAGGRVERTCGGDPAPTCRAGRWPKDAHGTPDTYLLGR